MTDPLKRLRTLRIICAAMMASGLIYAAILPVVVEGASGEDMGLLRLALSVAALGSMVAILPVRAVMMGGIGLWRSDQAPSGQGLPDAAAQQVLQETIERYFRGTFISFALAESVILFGFALAMLSGVSGSIFPFLLAGELVMVLLFPRVAAIEGLLPAGARHVLKGR